MSEPTQFNKVALRGEMLHDVPMSRYVSWRAGGRAEHLYRPADLSDLLSFLRQLPTDEPLVAVGLGSNLLVRDGGLRGTVLLMHGALDGLRRDGDDMVYAEAGVPGAKLARFAAANHLTGAEFFAGIPGTLGGMLAMNAGCHGSETWQKVMRVQVATRNGELLERLPAEYEIGYRHVALCEPSEEWFVSATLKFTPGDGEAARRQSREFLDRRAATQPLDLPNAGSVFRNPPGDFAARLIESCGLKGKRIGGAEVSRKHANFIVNTGEATAADIEDLIEMVRTEIEKKTGVLLQREVRIVGEMRV